MQTTATVNRWLTRKALAEILDCSQRAISYLAAEPNFPRRRRIPRVGPRWCAVEVDAWLKRQTS
jgi:predicted DNA-binding transcriptional regulator AlpA